MKILRRNLLPFLLLSLPLALPAAPYQDGMIEAFARQSYNLRVVLAGQVRVTSDHGKVTLIGSVPDEEARALAQDTVENLPGVTKVINKVTLAPGDPVRSDSWMAGKIRDRLLVRANVSAATTTVSVNDGVATLDGTATSPAQKDLTGVYAAEIDGVQSVTNRLTIDLAPSFNERIDDASITSQVRLALLNHKSTRTLKPLITTLDGAVLVSGAAGSDAEKALVTRVVQVVRGTTTVTNAMVVKT